MLGALAAGVFGKLMDHSLTSSRDAKQQQYTLDLMEKQNEYNTLAWGRDNEYNLPTKVVQRYRDAGINPRSVFGSGSASGAGMSGGITPMPSASSSLTSPINSFGSLGQDVLSGMETSANVKKIDAETLGQSLKNRMAEIETKYKESEIIANLSKLRAEIAEKLSKVRNNDALTAVYTKNLAEIDKRIESITKSIEESDSRIKKNQQDVVESATRVDAMNVEKEREQLKLNFEKKFKGAPMDLLSSMPGASAFLSYAITNGVEEGVDNLANKISEIKANPSKFPDPVGNFVRKNWPKLKEWLNKLDNKFTNGRTKPLK